MMTKTSKHILPYLLSFITAILLMSGVFAVRASAAVSGDYEYTVTDGEAEITDYTGTATRITIPSKLGGYPVTTIGYRAFKDCTSLTSITIPDSVTSIGYGAFCRCIGLTSITIPDSVTSIGVEAFRACHSLTSITIPDRVTSISVSAFFDCISLTSISIPDSVTSIGNNAFNFCESLKSITIPDGVTYIEANTFHGCTGLTSITIPDSVTTIFSSAFKDCTGLKDVYYLGSSSDWEKIKIYSGNYFLTRATIHYNCITYIKSPTNVKAVSGGGNVTVTWDAVENATSYRVFRSDSLTGARKLLKVRTSLYYIDTEVDTGKTYYYWLMAYNANKDVKSSYSSSSKVTVTDDFAKDISIKGVSVLSTSVTLKWDIVPGATSYRIYRRNDDGSRKLLAAQSMTEFKDTGLTKGKVYKYEIRAYSKTTGGLSNYSPIKQVRPMAAPTITGGTVKGKITWEKNAVATSYRVYRADSLTGAKKLLAPTTLLTYTDTTAEKGKTYYYFVAAYDSSTGTLSAYSQAKVITIA